MKLKLAEVQAFFFRAMMRGYASDDISPTRVFDMPGFQQIEIHEDLWRCVDRWSEREDSPRSTGTTTIWYSDVPVWSMSYGGWCDKDAIPFLKMALCENYAKNIFHGGRGPSNFRIPGNWLLYSNKATGNFANFSGKEEICLPATIREKGHHWYHGMSLLPK